MNYPPLFSVGYMLQNVICIQKNNTSVEENKKKRIELVLLYEMLSRMVYM